MGKIWEDACKIVEDNESRVRVEYQTVAGEENKVWRWLENTLNGVSLKLMSKMINLKLLIVNSNVSFAFQESNSRVWQGRGMIYLFLYCI